jgi:methionyl-tRNA formyltransferase
MGFINIHPSLLPRHRGASPLTATILEGDAETGVCLMVLDEAMDHGPIIGCRKISLKGDETTESLRQTIAPVASEMIEKELVEYLDGHVISVPQNHDQATFCKLIESDAARIDWRKPVVEIDRLIRAMHGVTPAWTTLEGQALLVHAAKIDKVHSVEEPGMIVKIQNSPAVAGADGYLVLDELQLAGGKPMSGQAFLNGHKDLIGQRLV